MEDFDVNINTETKSVPPEKGTNEADPNLATNKKQRLPRRKAES